MSHASSDTALRKVNLSSCSDCSSGAFTVSRTLFAPRPLCATSCNVHTNTAFDRGSFPGSNTYL